MTATFTKDTYDAAGLTGGENALPLSIEKDGVLVRTMRCTGIAGGARSTDGIPDFLHLTITDENKDPVTVEYTSERVLLAKGAPAPWPSFQLHPLEDRDRLASLQRCYVCGKERSDHGATSLHCPPAVLEPSGGASAELAIAHEILQRQLQYRLPALQGERAVVDADDLRLLDTFVAIKRELRELAESTPRTVFVRREIAAAPARATKVPKPKAKPKAGRKRKR